MHRALLVIAAVVVCLVPSPAPAAEVGPGYDIQMSRMIPMRDGVELESWIWRPTAMQKPAPTVLTLTQYDIDGARRGTPSTFTKRGYVFVQAYVRGRGRSGGSKSDNLGLQVGRDGYDLVEWIARQPWSDGRVVMYGGSFVGMTQWRTAAQHPPHLASITPYVPIYPGWDVPNTNGIPQAWSAVILGYTAGRSLNSGFVANRDYWAGKMLEHYAAGRPFVDLDDEMGIAPDDWWMEDRQGRRLSFMDMWLAHLGDEAFNLAAAPTAADYAGIDIPILTVTGFFDDDQPGALRYYRGHVEHGPANAVARHYLVIGPWDHGGAQQPRSEIGGLAVPPAAVVDMDELRADWFDWVLGRGPRPALLHDRVSYFMPGADHWRYAPTLEGASSGGKLTFYLSDADGTPGDLFHSGRLVSGARPGEPPALLVSDPRQLPELEVAAYAENEDFTSQFRAYEKGAISFHTDPLPAATEIAGHPRLTVAVQADAPDFDLWAELMMVLPDGSAVQLGEDVRRARFRDGPFTEELLTPDEVVEIPFQFYWTARRIPAGARLRLTVAPLNSPYYQKNTNTGAPLGYEPMAEARVAHIRLFHDAEHPGALVLPLAAAPAASD